MKSVLFTNEYPPHTYGGAGVHVEYLSRELAKLMEVDVRCFGDQEAPGSPLSVRGFSTDTSGYTAPGQLRGVFSAMQCGLDFNTAGIDGDLVHCHTWYTHLAGIVAKLNYGIPLVVTVHSLEPLRPWKREQLGGGYDFSCWVEKTALEMADAVVCVSEGTRSDVMKHFQVAPDRLHILYNGIDTEEYAPRDPSPSLRHYGIAEDRPYVLFVGRITRQKGIIHLVNAIHRMDPDYQVVLCAGAPDTPEIAAEMKAAVAAVQSVRADVYWIDEMVPKDAVIELYSGAAVFCCPSIYEPFGIINLEAMACATPVVAAAVGGIPEVVVHDETGYLVPLALSPDSPHAPLHPDSFSKDLADQVNRLMRNPERRRQFAAAGRQRAVEQFGWAAIARQTRDLYLSLLSSS